MFRVSYYTNTKKSSEKHRDFLNKREACVFFLKVAKKGATYPVIWDYTNHKGIGIDDLPTWWYIKGKEKEVIGYIMGIRWGE